MLKGIKFASIPVRDQDRALAFWTGPMGLVVATDQPFGGGQRWIELRIPGAETRLVLFTLPGHEDRIGGVQPVTFWTDDIDGAYARLAAAGVDTDGPPAKQGWGAAIKFRDPDGNTFVLSSK